MSTEQDSMQAQLAAAREMAGTIITTLATERGAHAETVIAAAARMGGTLMFRTFGFPDRGIAPGSPVLSDLANERGPVLVEVMKAALHGLGVAVQEHPIPEMTPDHEPHLTLLETQTQLDVALNDIRVRHGLSNDTGARACALAAAILIGQTQAVLDPSLGFAIAVYGFVEGTKTMPPVIS